MFSSHKLHEVMVLQQHCGGSTLCVFRELLPPNSKSFGIGFVIISYVIMIAINRLVNLTFNQSVHEAIKYRYNHWINLDQSVN